METTTIVAIASLIPGLGLFILRKWLSGFLVLYFFIMLVSTYTTQEEASDFLLVLIGLLWIGQYSAAILIAQKVDDEKFEDEIEEEAIEEIEQESEASELDWGAEYLAGGEIPSEYYLGSAAELPGWPGYRTQSGRSGYDPLDINFEATQMQGRFIHHLITGSLITTEPVYLILLAVTGLLSICPGAMGFWLMFQGDPVEYYALILQVHRTFKVQCTSYPQCATHFGKIIQL